MSLFPLDRVLDRMIRHGHLTVIDTDGARRDFGQPEAQPAVTIRVTDPAFPWRATLRPDLAVGEGYMDGAFVLEDGTLRDFLDVVLLSREEAEHKGALHRLRQRARQLYRTKDVINRVGRAARNVRHHYDINHDLYELFLDRDLQYSCAYFRDEAMDLEAAQLAKKEHLAGKLMLEPGMRVLDIGSGWGGLALHLAEHHGVTVTGVTLSHDQHETSVRRAAEAGLSDRVSFKLLDYRMEPGQYDRIVSVGMFEHVGRPHFGQFFDHLDRLLAASGIAVIHTIAKMTEPGPINDWVRRYIFPGAYLPSLSELAPVIERRGLLMTDLENLRLHYARTLAAWDARFQARRAEVAAMFDERFCRMWELYLQGCEAGFRHQGLCVFQMQLAKRVDAVPITRDYMYQRDPLGAAAVRPDWGGRDERPHEAEPRREAAE